MVMVYLDKELSSIAGLSPSNCQCENASGNDSRNKVCHFIHYNKNKKNHKNLCTNLEEFFSSNFEESLSFSFIVLQTEQISNIISQHMYLTLNMVFPIGTHFPYLASFWHVKHVQGCNSFLFWSLSV